MTLKGNFYIFLIAFLHLTEKATIQYDLFNKKKNIQTVYFLKNSYQHLKMCMLPLIGSPFYQISKKHQSSPKQR